MISPNDGFTLIRSLGRPVTAPLGTAVLLKGNDNYFMLRSKECDVKKTPYEWIRRIVVDYDAIEYLNPRGEYQLFYSTEVDGHLVFDQSPVFIEYGPILFDYLGQSDIEYDWAIQNFPVTACRPESSNVASIVWHIEGSKTRYCLHITKGRPYECSFEGLVKLFVDQFPTLMTMKGKFYLTTDTDDSRPFYTFESRDVQRIYNPYVFAGPIPATELELMQEVGAVEHMTYLTHSDVKYVKYFALFTKENFKKFSNKSQIRDEEWQYVGYDGKQHIHEILQDCKLGMDFVNGKLIFQIKNQVYRPGPDYVAEMTLRLDPALEEYVTPKDRTDASLKALQTIKKFISA